MTGFWSQPVQCLGHSNETSPPKDKASSAHSTKERNIARERARRFSSLCWYCLPCLKIDINCQVDHTVQGNDPCSEVPGFDRIWSLIASTQDRLEKSCLSVMRMTSTLLNSSAAAPRFEFGPVQISNKVPHPGYLPLALARECLGPLTTSLTIPPTALKRSGT